MDQHVAANQKESPKKKRKPNAPPSKREGPAVFSAQESKGQTKNEKRRSATANGEKDKIEKERHQS